MGTRAPLRACMLEKLSEWLLAGVMLLALSFGAQAQTTSGNAATGNTLFNGGANQANCTFCHGSRTENPVFNAANAGGVLSYAITNGMGACLLDGTGAACARALNVTELNNIAAYIGAGITIPNPTGVAVPFQGSSGAVAMQDVAFSATWGGGAIQSLIQVTPNPAKGSVVFTGLNANYTAGACFTGTDTVNFRGSGNAGTTNARQFTVNIAGPTSGPTITSGNTSGQTGVSFTYNTTFTPNCPSLTTFGASGLPAGLTINASTGVVSGTPTTVGVSNATITATQNGNATNKGVTFTITLGPPVVNSANTKAGAVGFALTYQITATNSPTSYNASGLPPGLSVDTTTGLISGTPTTNGTFNATVSATNGTGTGNLGVQFNIAVGVPVITSSNTANGQTGQPFSYQITATNGPTSYSATGLPAGLSINTGTGLISGTPTTIASTPVTLTATNATGTSSNFTLTIDVTLGPPVINSTLTANGAVAQAFSYQITATQSPTSFNATGLPAGLTVDTTTGLISGAPAASGTFNVTISATNATGTGNATLVISVALFAPVITSAPTASGQTGVAFTYQITAANGPTSYNATGLPPGLTVNTGTGLISGIPTTIGVFAGTISATNGAGTGNQGLTITITLGPPVITSAATANGVQGTPMTYQITASNSPTSYNATGLPAGLTVNTANGLISGTPSVMGSFPVTVSATNATGTGSTTVNFNIAIGPPVVTSAGVAAGQTGSVFTYAITATNSPTSFAATGLPAGLTVDTVTGVISGVPIPSGVFNGTISATNVTGTGTKAFTVTVTQGAPGITSPATATATTGQPFTYQITAVNSPGSYGATGLPPGLTINTTTGVISGIPTTGGTFIVTISATNSGSTTSQVLTITIAFIAPAVADLSVTTGFNTALVINLPATGVVSQVRIVTPPANGTLTGPAFGTAQVTYTPAIGFSGTDSFTYLATGPGGTSTTATVTIEVGTLAPVANAVTMTVPLNSALTVDLRTFITGSGLTGVAVVKAPTHGTVTVSGTKVTYTPHRNYFGADSFTYRAFGNAGSSAPALVSVVVVGRSDPSREASVIGVVGTQASTAQRFARAQIGNFQQHLESMHPRAPEASASPSASRAPARAAPRAESEPVMLASAGGSGITGPLPNATTSALSAALANSILSLASAQSLGINARTGYGSMLPEGVEMWIAGNLRFGHRDPTGADRVRFTTDGVSAGIDRRFSDRLALGVGLGFARDKADIGTDGSRNDTDGTAVAAYGSYRVGGRTFVDALVGFATLDLESSRFVPLLNDYARGSRRGNQWFGSISASYEHRLESLLLSPYARLDYASTRLKQATETGAGGMALTFHEQSVPMFQGTVGVRAESQHETRFGSVRPRARVEFSREFESDRAAIVSYADEFGTRYSVTPSGVKRNALLLGLGSDFHLGGGLRLGLDYQVRRGSREDLDQGIRLQVTQALDGRGTSRLAQWFGTSTPFDDPVRVEAGYTYEDNVTRARAERDKLADNIFTFSASKGRVFPMASNMRVVGNLFVTGEEFRRYTGLGRFGGGVSGEVQYRTDGDWGATTFGLQGRATGDYYDTPNRRGYKASIGLTVRQALTDRMDAFAALTGTQRWGRSVVFDMREYGAKVNLDYALAAPHGSFYLGGEYRRGDAVSSGRFSLENIDIAEAFTPDEAFGPGFFAYRFEAKTWIGTFGYNRPLGPRDGIDFSYRRIQSYPLDRPGFPVPGAFRYIDNQYSIVYLMRF